MSHPIKKKKSWNKTDQPCFVCVDKAWYGLMVPQLFGMVWVECVCVIITRVINHSWEHSRLKHSIYPVWVALLKTKVLSCFSDLRSLSYSSGRGWSNGVGASDRIVQPKITETWTIVYIGDIIHKKKTGMWEISFFFYLGHLVSMETQTHAPTQRAEWVWAEAALQLTLSCDSFGTGQHRARVQLNINKAA